MTSAPTPGVLDALRNLGRALFRAVADPSLAGFRQQLATLLSEIRIMSMTNQAATVAVQAALASLKTQFDAKDAQITGLTTTNTSLITQNQTLTAQLADRDTTIASLQAKANTADQVDPGLETALQTLSTFAFPNGAGDSSSTVQGAIGNLLTLNSQGPTGAATALPMA